MRLGALAVAGFVMLAGCSTSGSGDTGPQDGSLELRLFDDAAGARIVLAGAFLHSQSGWIEALPNGTVFELRGSGGNVSSQGDVPAGAYDRMRLLFDSVTVANRTAILVENGIEISFVLNVTAATLSRVTLGVAWADSLFESQAGLAFEPVVDRLVAVEAGNETLRLDAQGILTGTTKAPVARMRIFDETGLEVFGSTFVADSPENVLIGNAGLLTMSASPSEALEPGAQIVQYLWDVDDVRLTGTNAQHQTSVDGGYVTVRLTVIDSADGSDTQTVRLALKPGFSSRNVTFTGSVSGVNYNSGTAAGGGNVSHPFPVNMTSLDGAPARLVRMQATLEGGTSTLITQGVDLDFSVRDANGTVVGTSTGTSIAANVPATAMSGNWTVRITPQRAYQTQYSVSVVLTWQGVNPEIEAFLKAYDDGHSHEH